MDIKNPSRRGSSQQRRGATTFQLVVILVPVLLAFMGFAVDYGRLYMIRNEMQAAANASALAAAARLGGFDAALDAATEQANTAVAEAAGFANKIDYGGRVLGGGDTLTSTVEEPQFFDTVAGATGQGDGGGGGTGVLRHVRVSLLADAPTVFFRFLPLAQEGRVPIRVQAAAGVSAPLCVACNIEPIVIAAPDAAETIDFGFTVGTRYTLGYTCTGQPTPQPIAGSVQRLQYLMLNRWDQDSEVPEQTQAFRMGLYGMPGNASELKSCLNIANTETVWESALAGQCLQNNVPAVVRGFTCGLANRFEAGVFAGCETVQDSDTYSQSVLPDSDISDTDDYQSTYAGNTRRVITIAIAADLVDATAITIAGFRQFLVNPLIGATNINPLDPNGRFLLTYIGSPAPLRQGRFSGCSTVLDGGPGKVVLHQ